MTEVVAADALDAAAAAMCAKVAAQAPLTLRACKETIRRVLTTSSAQVSNDDLVRLCYGSEDFKRGVAAFSAKKRALWEGR